MGSVRDYIAAQEQDMNKTAASNGIGALAVILPLLALAGGAYAFRDKLGLGGDEGEGIDVNFDSALGAKRHGGKVGPKDGEFFKGKSIKDLLGGDKGGMWNKGYRRSGKPEPGLNIGDILKNLV